MRHLSEGEGEGVGDRLLESFSADCTNSFAPGLGDAISMISYLETIQSKLIVYLGNVHVNFTDAYFEEIVQKSLLFRLRAIFKLDQVSQK